MDTGPPLIMQEHGPGSREIVRPDSPPTDARLQLTHKDGLQPVPHTDGPRWNRPLVTADSDHLEFPLFDDSYGIPLLLDGRLKLSVCSLSVSAKEIQPEQQRHPRMAIGVIRRWQEETLDIRDGVRLDAKIGSNAVHIPQMVGRGGREARRAAPAYRHPSAHQDLSWRASGDTPDASSQAKQGQRMVQRVPSDAPWDPTSSPPGPLEASYTCGGTRETL
jgi:hypothetical protein